MIGGKVNAISPFFLPPANIFCLNEFTLINNPVPATNNLQININNTINMKNKLTALFAIIIVMIGTTIYSCRKDTITRKTLDSERDQIREWYNSKVNKSGSNQFSTLSPIWETISVKEQLDQLVYEMKMNNPNRIFVGNEVTDKSEAAGIATRTSTRLLVFKDKKSGLITSGCYMSIINDGAANALNVIHYKQAKDFTGRIYYFNMDGSFGNGWSYIEGLISERIAASTKENYFQSQRTLSDLNSKLPKGQDKSAILQEIDCFTAAIAEWGSTCVVGHGCDYYITGYEYITICSNGNGGSSGGDGGYGGDGGGGASGGSDGGSTGEEVTDTVIISEPTQINKSLKYCNFNFQEVFGSQWQAAGIRGIGIILANDGPLMFNIEVGLPMFSTALNRTIGRLEAQRASAAAYEIAMWKINALYNMNKITKQAIPGRVAREMETALNSALGFTKLKLNIARVSNTLGINEGAPASTADFNLDCK